jgi:PKD-like domain
MKFISRGMFFLLFICLFIFFEKESIAQITLKSDHSETLCAGTLVTFTATTTSCTGDIKQYNWVISNGISNLTGVTRKIKSDTSIFTTNTLKDGESVLCEVFWNSSCNGSSSKFYGSPYHTVISSPPSLTSSIAGKSNSVCEGTINIYSVTPASNATSYIWSLPKGWTGSSIVDSVTATTSANSGTITVVANNSCGSSNKLSLPVAVKAKPATPGPISGPTTICVGTINTYSVTPVFGVIDYAWLSSINGWSIVGLDSTNVISMATKDFSSSGNLIVLAKNECGFRLDSIIEKEITVNKMPVIPNQTDTVCSGSTFKISPVNIDSTIVPKGTTYTWSKPSYTGSVGDVTGGTAQSNKPAISDVLINHTSVFQTATYTVTPTSGACTGKPFIQNVILKTLPAAPSAIIGKDTSCANLANTYSVTAQPGITSYTWSLPKGWSGTSTTNSISATTTSVTSIGTLTVAANNGCNSLPITKAVKVIAEPAKPDSIYGPNPICALSLHTYSVTPVPDVTSYLWPRFSSFSWSGDSKTNSIDVLSKDNPGNDIDVLVIAVNQCGQSNMGGIHVIVNSIPVIPSQSTTICSGNTFTVSPVNAGTTIVPDSTTYTWSKPSYSGKVGDVTGGTAKSNKLFISDELINHTDTIQTATYTITPTAGACSGSAFTTKIKIFPSPIITNKTVTICSGSTFTVSPVNGKGTLLFAGTTYSWDAPTVTGGITSFAAQTGQSNIVQTLNNPSNLIQTATYTVTPKSAITGNCDGQPFLINVSVNPNIVLPAQSFTVCNAVPFNIDLSDGAGALVPKGTKYSWLKPTYSGAKGNLTGGTAQSSYSTSITGTLINKTLVAQTAKYTVTPKLATCIGNPFIANITVDPNFVIKNMSAAVCNGSPINVIPVSDSVNVIPSGLTYSWGLPEVTGGMTGAIADSNQPAIAQLLINPTVLIQTATYTVVPTTERGCVGTSFILIDSILPRPLKPSVSDFSNVQNQQITTQFCGGSTNISFNVNDPIEGCTYLWTALPKDLVTVRKNVSPNTVISFDASSTMYPATISVQPVFPSNRGDCAAVNVISTYTVSVGALTVKDSQNVFVQQPGNLLICSDMNADSYQWGYDSIADGKPYFIAGQEGQTFFPDQRFLTKEETPKLNLSDYWFWVITYHGKGSYTCKNKVYYNGPYSNNNVLKFELASLNLNDNPTKGAFDLMVKGDFYGNVTILVSDMFGQVIQQSDFKKPNGIETYHFDFTNLSVGIYVIQVRNDDMDAPLSTKLMIVR